MAGISKQAMHSHRKRSLEKERKTIQIFEQADKYRKGHPRVGCRKMAMGLRLQGWGRDKVEHLLLGNGYRVFYPVRYCRTTQSQQDLYFPNLTEGLELTDINQVVQTDITYYPVKDKFYYLVFLIDVYSRYLVGFSVNKTLEAEGNIQALKKMLTFRKHECCNLIHHSDRGSQYIDKVYLSLLIEYKIQISMCKQAWQNPYAERINRTIKDEYLDGWKINSFECLGRSVAKAVHHYNNKRRHNSLGGKTPQQFEEYVNNLPKELRPKIKLYKPLE